MLVEPSVYEGTVITIEVMYASPTELPLPPILTELRNERRFMSESDPGISVKDMLIGLGFVQVTRLPFMFIEPAATSSEGMSIGVPSSENSVMGFELIFCAPFAALRTIFAPAIEISIIFDTSVYC